MENEKEEGMPAYRFIAREIMKDINNGTYLPGAKLPTEATMGRTYNVSRMTIKKALSELTSLGLVRSVRGSGTFVSDFDGRYTMNASLGGWTERIQAIGKNPKSKILHFQIMEGDWHICRKLKIKDHSRIIYIERIRYINDLPAQIETVYLVHDMFPELTQEILSSNSLYDIMRDQHGIVLESSLQSLRATILTGEKAKLLGNQESMPALALEVYTLDKYSQTVEYGVTYINTDIYSPQYIVKR